MTSAALCLSLALQLPVASEPLVVDHGSLLALQQALQSFGEFQQPYSAPVDVTDPDAGAADATVEISAGCVEDGPEVIILDDDVDDSSERYLVLNEPWQSLPTGTLLLVSGSTATVISTQEASTETAQAERMLAFLDYLPLGADSTTSIGQSHGPLVPGMDPEEFLRNFTASSKGEAVPEATLAAWRGVLPDLLLALWRRDGFARYRSDKLAMVDPGRYTALVEAYLRGNPLEGADTFHAYAVTAFGQILICGETTAIQISIDAHSGDVSADLDADTPGDAAERDLNLGLLLTFLDGHYLDVTDEDEQPLYKRAYERLGPLAPDEIYSFSPAVSEGGWNAAHLVKTDRLAELEALAATVTRTQPTQPDVSGR